jgi:hypothetical protein
MRIALVAALFLYSCNAKPPVPAPPSSPVIECRWAASTDAQYLAGYFVYRDGVRLNAKPINALVYDDNSAVAGQTYTYYVTAYDGVISEESIPSNTITIKVQ